MRPTDKFTVLFSSAVRGVNFYEDYHYSESNKSAWGGTLTSAETGKARLTILPSDAGGVNPVEVPIKSMENNNTEFSFNVLAFDALGNPLESFRDLKVEHLKSDTIEGDVHYSYTDITALGIQNASIIGNAYSNTLIGSDLDDIIIGGFGRDNLSGGQGRDTFVYQNTLDSVLRDPITGLNAVDKITDLEIGTDILDVDAMWKESQTNIIEVEGTIDLSESAIREILGNSMDEFGSTILNSKSSGRSYLILNNKNSVFDEEDDMFIEITGYSGEGSDLRFI